MRSRRQPNGNSTWRILLTGLMLLSSLAVAPVARAVEDSGYMGPSFAGAGNAPSGEKPESKLWWNDGFWWASLWSTGSSRFNIFRLNLATQTWADTGTALDPRTGSRADVLWDGAKLYVASHKYTTSTGPTTSANASKLWRYSYDAGSDQYSIDPGFPVNINLARMESLVIDKDSKGTLWATWVQQTTATSGVYKVYINHTIGGDDTKWDVPTELPGDHPAVAKDDISSLVSFDTNTTSPKILLMWSNQRDHTVNVAIHIDGQPETSWTPRRIAYSGSNSADDHINLKSLESDDSGRVFAAIKTSRTGASDPLVVLLVYNRSTGAWSNAVFGTVADKHTRPIILLDKTNNIIHIYAAADEGGGSIYGKTTSMSSPRFAGGRGTPFIEEAATPGLGGRLNNATSTKQSVNCQTGIVVLATNDTSDRYWHNYEAIPGCGSVPTLPVANFSATPRTGTAPLTVSFSDSSTNNPTSWAWDFDNSGNVDSTIPNPSFTYTTAGTYTVKLTVTNADGADTEIKTGYIVVGSEGGSSTVTLLPNGDAARDAVIKDQASATTNLYAAIDETIAATDNSSTWIRNNSNTSGSYLAQLGDMPANFSDMLTLSIDIQVRTTSRVDDNTTLYAQVVKANGTALTNEIAVASNPGLTAWTTISGVAFTGVAPATKADWDGAHLKLRWAYTATGTADGTQVRLSTVELDGTFN